MSDQLWAAIIGVCGVFVAQGFVFIGAWVAVQVRVRALEIRVKQGEKERDSDRESIKELVAELHNLAVQIAVQNRQHSGGGNV